MEAAPAEADMAVATVMVQEQTQEAVEALDESTQKIHMKTELVIQLKVNQEIDS